MELGMRSRNGATSSKRQARPWAGNPGGPQAGYSAVTFVEGLPGKLRYFLKGLREKIHCFTTFIKTW